MMYEDSSSKGVNADRKFKESVSTQGALLLLSHTRAYFQGTCSLLQTHFFLSSPQTIYEQFFFVINPFITQSKCSVSDHNEDK